jgi:hypothetical protein
MNRFGIQAEADKQKPDRQGGLSYFNGTEPSLTVGLLLGNFIHSRFEAGELPTTQERLA